MIPRTSVSSRACESPRMRQSISWNRTCSRSAVPSAPRRRIASPRCIVCRAAVVFTDSAMEIRCPRCGNLAAPAGHEDARAFYQCEKCDRVWMTFLTSGLVETAKPTTKVLVVDDSNELLGLIGAWLQDEGYILFTATSGVQAIDIAKSHDPDVVLLDVVIPPPDGFSVCQSLQHLDHPPEII